ncbi:MAG: oligosaccharide flippase family protein [Bacteroidaceae bacterium]|nr:oligosaccharide flippase family protein [Bacteroidaceae bacterium]
MSAKNQENRSSEAERRLFDRILKYTGVFGSVQGVSMIVTLVINMVKSRLLGPVGYGITESLNRTTDLVKNSTNLGITTVAVPEISRHAGEADADVLADKVRLTRSWALLTAMLGMAVCLILAPVLSRYAFDGDGSYTVSFMVLSLAVAATAITGGETAVLRGSGMLRQLALSQLFTYVLSLCVSVPLYWIFNLNGIVPALALTAVGGSIVTCFYSFKRFPYKASPFSWSFLKTGFGMMGFGVFFTVTSFLGAWAWSYIAKYLTGAGGPELTGTYSAGYMLVTYLTNLLLAVTDSEYYPRLSGAGNDMPQAHHLMSNQALAMCMLAGPIVILFMLCMPLVVYVVLDYDSFQPSIILAQMAVIGLFFKSVSQPIAYLVLARSDSRIYLIQETVCYALLVTCVIAGYKYLGITGLGLSFAVWELIYLLLALLISKFRYGYVMSSDLVKNFLAQGVMVAVTALCVFKGGRMWIVAGAVICIVSIVFSVRFFSRRTTFIQTLISKVTRR